MRFGYRKIFLGETSCNEQGLEPVDQIFEDRITDTHSIRPELDDLINFASKDDKIFIQRMDLLGRDVRDLYRIISSLLERGASVRFVNEDLNFVPQGKKEDKNSLIGLLENLANFEGMIIKRRQREGIHRAKQLQKYKGRKPKIDPDLVREEFSKTGKVSLVAKNLKISRMSVYRLIKRTN